MTTTNHTTKALDHLQLETTDGAAAITHAILSGTQLLGYLTDDLAGIRAQLQRIADAAGADVRGPAHAREGDGEPVPPVEPADAEPSPADSRFDADGWKYGVRWPGGGVSDHWNGSTQRTHAVELATRYAGTVLVRRRRDAEWEPAPADVTDEPDAVEPTPGPVVLPTTPGSVAWTRDGGVFALTDDDDVTPWYALAGPRRRNRLRLSGYLPAGELLALDVVRVRDSGDGA